MTALGQGDVRLLETELAQKLLSSTLPARLAYVATDGTPRIVPTWFQWTGTEVVMAAFVAGALIHRPAARVQALRANPAVAITIDTDGLPPEALALRGEASVTEVDGIDADYAKSAQRYMGEEAAAQYLARYGDPGTRMARIAVRPTWVSLVDFQTRLPGPLGGVLDQPPPG
jgi:hypothetical protein